MWCSYNMSSQPSWILVYSNLNSTMYTPLTAFLTALSSHPSLRLRTQFYDLYQLFACPAVEPPIQVFKLVQQFIVLSQSLSPFLDSSLLILFSHSDHLFTCFTAGDADKKLIVSVQLSLVTQDFGKLTVI